MLSLNVRSLTEEKLLVLRRALGEPLARAGLTLWVSSVSGDTYRPPSQQFAGGSGELAKLDFLRVTEAIDHDIEGITHGAERDGCYAIRRLGEGDSLKLADAKMSGMIVARAKELTAEGEDFRGSFFACQCMLPTS